MTPRSPVWNQPPRNASAVAASSSRYPAVTVLDRIRISPVLVPSAGSGRSLSSAIWTSATEIAGTPCLLSRSARAATGRSVQAGWYSQTSDGP